MVLENIPGYRTVKDFAVGPGEEFDLFDDDPLESFTRGFILGVPPMGFAFGVGQQAAEREIDWWEVAGGVTGTVVFASISFGLFAGELSTSAMLVGLGTAPMVASSLVLGATLAVAITGFLVEKYNTDLIIEHLWSINTNPVL